MCYNKDKIKREKKKEVIKMFTVFYKRYNPYKSYAMVANKRVASKSFRTEAEAREFAAQVNGYKVVNPIGQII